MDYFNLPSSTIVKRVVPKNSFDSYTTKMQKVLFTKDIAKITWRNNLSQETINLSGQDIREIQIFSIELKAQKEIKSVLNLIDRAIPYHIIFVVEFEDLAYLSTSAKHSSPLDLSKSTIDWTFKSPWFSKAQNPYNLELKKNLDTIFYDFCNQLSVNHSKEKSSLSELISYESEYHIIKSKIELLRKQITSCKQFNKKIELNLEIKELELKLKSMVI